MTTRKRNIKAKRVEDVIDHDGHDVQVLEKEVETPKLPQLYQSTVYVNTSPQSKEVIGHIEFSETTGILKAIPTSSKYDVDLQMFADSGIVLSTDNSIVISPHTKDWLLNVHKAVVHRDWEVTEAWNRDEI